MTNETTHLLKCWMLCLSLQDVKGGGWDFYASNGITSLLMYRSCPKKDWPMIKKEMRDTFGMCKFMVIQIWNLTPEIIPDAETIKTNITMEDV